MIPYALLLSVLSWVQEPQPERAANFDVIVLVNGEEFEGRITTELEGYVEFVLDHGAMVGIARNRIAEIRRGKGAQMAAVPAALSPRDEWFVLHDAQGASVGWLHAVVVTAHDGTVTASEEYEFQEGRRRYQVTSQCTAGADLRSSKCYFRERILEPIHGIAMQAVAASVGRSIGQPDRVGDERIVEARRVGDRLVVTRIDGSGRRERDYAFAENGTFPLLARAIARATGGGVLAVEMFDPATEEMGLRSIEEARRRAVQVNGERRQVTEIVESGSHTNNSEWLDGSMKTLRREIAGPALVAMPCSERSAHTAVGTLTIPAALAREAEGAFALWLPNPAWRAEPDMPPGQVALACDAHGASIGLTRIDHLTAGTRTDLAADAVANWFRLLHPDLRILRRESALVRDRRAVRLVAGGREAAQRTRATVDVIPHDGGFLVLVCRAADAAWDELAADFAFVQRTVEFEPESVEPPLQGPLLQREQQKKSLPQHKQPTVRIPLGESPATVLPATVLPATVLPGGVPAPAPMTERKLPVVKIPSDG